MNDNGALSLTLTTSNNSLSNGERGRLMALFFIITFFVVYCRKKVNPEIAYDSNE